MLSVLCVWLYIIPQPRKGTLIYGADRNVWASVPDAWVLRAVLNQIVRIKASGHKLWMLAFVECFSDQQIRFSELQSTFDSINDQGSMSTCEQYVYRFALCAHYESLLSAAIMWGELTLEKKYNSTYLTQSLDWRSYLSVFTSVFYMSDETPICCSPTFGSFVTPH